jgi:lipopolysaccharide export system protein LptC
MLVRAERILAPLTLGVLFVAAACESAPSNEAASGALPEVTLYGVRMQNFRGDQLSVHGWAARVTYERSNGEMTAYESFFRFPGRDGGVQGSGMDLHAGTLVGRLSEQQAMASGGVVISSARGVTAQSEQVRFDGRRRVAEGNQRVAVQGPGYSLAADGFELQFQPEIFTFTGNVESRLGEPR